MSNHINYHVNSKQLADLNDIHTAKQAQDAARTNGADATAVKAADKTVSNACTKAANDHISSKTLNKFTAADTEDSAIAKARYWIKNGKSSSDSSLTQGFQTAYALTLFSSGKKDTSANRSAYVQRLSSELQKSGVSGADTQQLLAPLQAESRLKASSFLSPSKRA